MLQQAALVRTPLGAPRLVQIDQPMKALEKQALDPVLSHGGLPALGVRRLSAHISITNMIACPVQPRHSHTRTFSRFPLVLLERALVPALSGARVAQRRVPTFHLA